MEHRRNDGFEPISSTAFDRLIRIFGAEQLLGEIKQNVAVIILHAAPAGIDGDLSGYISGTSRKIEAFPCLARYERARIGVMIIISPNEELPCPPRKEWRFVAAGR